MSNNAEQYTVKTPEEILKRTFGDYLSFYGKGSLIKCMKEYSSELIKQNYEALTAYNRECERNDELQKEIDRLKGTIGVECVKQLIAAREENKLYREALTRIRYPMKYLQQEADREGNQLDGNAAFQLSNAPSFLKSIAEEALSKFQPKKDERTNG